jgi:hypothetical protein
VAHTAHPLDPPLEAAALQVKIEHMLNKTKHNNELKCASVDENERK